MQDPQQLSPSHPLPPTYIEGAPSRAPLLSSVVAVCAGDKGNQDPNHFCLYRSNPIPTWYQQATPLHQQAAAFCRVRRVAPGRAQFSRDSCLREKRSEASGQAQMERSAVHHSCYLGIQVSTCSDTTLELCNAVTNGSHAPSKRGPIYSSATLPAASPAHQHHLSLTWIKSQPVCPAPDSFCDCRVSPWYYRSYVALPGSFTIEPGRQMV